MAKESNQQKLPPQSFKDKPKKSPTCTHCGYNGHTVDKCFQLHGYPPGWNGPKGKRNMAFAHATITTLEVPNQNSNEQQKFCFTLEEFHKLMALANLVQPNSSNQNNVQPAVNLVTTSHFSGKPNSTSYWLLDTGATYHMICSPLLYHSTPKPINASINLPNGTISPPTHIGITVNGEDDWDCS
ncbi:hypothetical protein AAG906_040214 [Vitis piasezkii]